jgi:hypothetical protein
VQDAQAGVRIRATVTAPEAPGKLIRAKDKCTVATRIEDQAFEIAGNSKLDCSRALHQSRKPRSGIGLEM